MYKQVIVWDKRLFRNIQRFNKGAIKANRIALKHSANYAIKFLKKKVPIGPIRAGDEDHKKLKDSFKIDSIETEEQFVNALVNVEGHDNPAPLTLRTINGVAKVANEAPHAYTVEYGYQGLIPWKKPKTMILHLPAANVRHPKGSTIKKYGTLRGIIFRKRVKGHDEQPFMSKIASKEALDAVLEIFIKEYSKYAFGAVI